MTQPTSGAEKCETYVRWKATGGGALLTTPDVLRRLGLTNRQEVDEATGWAVICANHDRIAKMVEDAPS